MKKTIIYAFLIFYHVISLASEELSVWNLFKAIEQSNVHTVKELFNSGIDYSAKIKNSALCHAIKKIEIRSIDKYNFPEDKSIVACYDNAFSVVELLLYKNADPNYRHENSSYNIFKAIDCYNSSLLALLLTQRANVYIQHHSSNKLPIQYAEEKCCPSSYKEEEMETIIHLLKAHMKAAQDTY